MPPKVRKVEKLEHGQWVEGQFRQLQPGDLFRVFEPDGTPLRDGQVFRAEETAEPPDERSTDTGERWSIRVRAVKTLPCE